MSGASSGSDTGDDGATSGRDDVEGEHEGDGEREGRPAMEAVRYDDGTLAYPGHPIGPEGGEPVETVDLSEHTAEIVTWTTSTAPPPGVPEPNHLAVVEFDLDGEAVRALGQLTTGDVEIGEAVAPTYVEQLREPGAGIREPGSQEWDGYRFEPTG